MRTKRTMLWMALALALIAVLASCGGGGDDGAATTTTYTVGGTVSGLTSAGLVLQNNGGDDLAVAANSASFTFATAVANSSAYAVTVKTQPTGQICAVTNGSGTIAGSNVASVSLVHCKLNS